MAGGENLRNFDWTDTRRGCHGGHSLVCHDETFPPLDVILCMAVSRGPRTL